MRDKIHIAAAQFEHKDTDTAFNLSRIAALTAEAVAAGAEAVSFHETCVCGYTFLQSATRNELAQIAEAVPDGPSCRALQEISTTHGVPVLAGLLERDGDKFYNTYVAVTASGVVARHRKLHAFVNPHLSSGDSFTLFDLLGCRCAILICYDNNLSDNARVCAVKGAEIIFAPHVTGCSPSAMPGRGLVDPALWAARHENPVALRQELNGPKGRGWLMRWLPARAWENGVFVVFTNPIGMDGGEVRNGNAMVLDAFGEVVAECHKLGDDVCVARCLASTFNAAGGRRYIRARRPELYGALVEASAEPPATHPGWQRRPPADAAAATATQPAAAAVSGPPVSAQEASVLAAAQVLYEFMQVREQPPLQRADAIMVLGSNDVRVAHHAAALHAGGLAPVVVFSGKQGRATEWLGERTEAEWLAEAAQSKGLPKAATLIEPTATNTGENIRNSREVLAAHFGGQAAADAKR